MESKFLSKTFNGILPYIYVGKVTLENNSSDINFIDNPHIDSSSETKVFIEDGKLIVQNDGIKFDALNSINKNIITLECRVKKTQSSTALLSDIESDIGKYINFFIFQSKDKEITEDLRVQNKTLFDIMFDAKYKDNTRVINYSSLVTNNSINEENEIVFYEKFFIKQKIEHLCYFLFSYIDIEAMCQDLGFSLGAEKVISGDNAAELVFDAGAIVSMSFLLKNKEGSFYDGPFYKKDDKFFSSIDDSELLLETVQNAKIQDFRNNGTILSEIISKLSIDKTINNINDSVNSMFSEKRDTIKNNRYFSDFLISQDKEKNLNFVFSLNIDQIVKENTEYSNILKKIDPNVIKNAKIKTIKVSRIRISNNSGDIDEIKNDDGYTPFMGEEDYPETVISTGDPEGKVIKLDNDRGFLEEISVNYQSLLNKNIRTFNGTDKLIKNISFGKYKYCIEVQLLDPIYEYLSVIYNDFLNEYSKYANFETECLYNGEYNEEINSFSNSFVESQKKKYEKDPSNSPWVSCVSSFIKLLNILSVNDINKDTINFLQFISNPITGNLDTISRFLKLYEDLLYFCSSFLGIDIVPISTGRSSFIKNSSNVSRSKNSYGKVFYFKVFSNNFVDVEKFNILTFDYLSTSTNELDFSSNGVLKVNKDIYQQRAKDEILKFFKDDNVDISIKTQDRTYSTRDDLRDFAYTYISPVAIHDSLNNFGKTTVKPSLVTYSAKDSQILSDIFSKSIATQYSKKSPILPMKTVSNIDYSGIKSDKSNKYIYSSRFITEKGLSFDKYVPESIDSSILESLKSKEPKTILDYQAKDLRSPKISNTKETLNKQIIEKGSFSKFKNNSKEDFSDIFIGENPLSNDKIEQEQSCKKQSVFQKISSALVDTLMSSFVKADNKLGQLAKGNNILKTFDLKSKDNSLNRLSEDEIKQLPLQVKSLYIASNSPDKVTFNWNDKTNPILSKDENMFSVNYNSIQGVEVLSGFSEDPDGNINMNDPIWEKLDANKFDSLDSGKFVCRMTDYQNSKIGIEKNNYINGNVLNKHFILDSNIEMQNNQIESSKDAINSTNDVITLYHKKNTRTLL